MQTLGTSSRARALIASGLAVALVGGGVAAGQFMSADAAGPLVPAATASASPTASTPPSSAASSTSTPTATDTVSTTPSATPTGLVVPNAETRDDCVHTDEQLRQELPDAEVRQEGGRTNYYADGRLVASTTDGKGWGPPCTVK